MKTCLNSGRLGCLMLAAAIALPSHAQSTEGTLSETMVTATRVATPVTDVIADVSIIDRAALERAGQSSLADVLAQQPGIQMVTSGSYRSSTNIYLRGASGTQAIVLIDGVRVGSATSGVASFENISLARIERIEILRGAASALYGPDAVGGVIQIFTREPSEGLQLGANLGVGTDGQQQAGASVRGSSGAVGYSLGVSKEKAAGISTVSTPLSTSFNPDADGFTSQSIDARLTAKLSAAHGLSLGVLRSETDYQFDGKPSSPNPLTLTGATTDAWARPRLQNVSARWDAQWTVRWKSSLLLGSSSDDSISDYYRISDGAFGGTSKFSTSRRQTTWQNDIAFAKDVLSLALENRSEAVDSTTSYTVKGREIRSAWAAYALNRRDWNALAVVRNDDNSQFGSFNNWSLSGGYRLTANLRAIASVGTSFQAPTFNQLYYPNYGNTALVPQMNRAAEAGLKFQRGNTMLSAVIYRNDIQGFINTATNEQSSLAVLRGVTLSASVQSGATSYTVSYDYADPRSYATTASSNDVRLVRVAQHMVNARVSHQLGSVTAFGELRLSSDREDNNFALTGRDTLAGYSLLNMGVNWKIQKNVSMLARLNNLTDASYMLANGYSMPGRNLFVSVAWSL